MCASNDGFDGTERERHSHTLGVVLFCFALIFVAHIVTTAVTLVRTARTFNQMKIVIIPRDSHRPAAQKKSTKPFSTQINP